MSHRLPEPVVLEETRPRRWSILALLALSQTMLIIDVTVVNVALPSIGQDLRLDRATLTWVATAYTLLFGSLLLLGGRLADLFGRRRIFLAGLTIFTGASFASGLATDGTILVAARALQGIGAALMSPAALSIVTTTFSGADRTRALGVWAAVGGSGAAIGVVLGGVLTSSIGWQWIFFVNVPVGIAVAFTVLRIVTPGRTASSMRGVDIPGAVTAALTIGLLLYGLIGAGDSGWTSLATLGPIAVAGLGVGAFLWLERRAAGPLVDLGLVRQIGGPVIVMIAASGMLAAGFFLSSLYLQRVLGLSAIETGLTFLPGAVAIIVTAQAGAHAIGRVGGRPVAAAAFAIAALGAIILSRVPAGGGSAILDVLPGLILVSAGIGPAFVAGTTGAFARAGQGEAGMTSGLVNTGHELGFALGVSIVSAVGGASLAAEPTLVGGFAAAFLATSIAGALAAAAALVLLPAGRPAIAGHAFAH